MPPSAHTPKLIQNGNPLHQPTITSPGSTKMIADSVPAAEASVCTMLFSCMLPPPRPLSSAIEITAAGIEVAKVSPALSPKYTLAAVNTSVITMPRITPRTVSSRIDDAAVVAGMLRFMRVLLASVQTARGAARRIARRVTRSGRYRAGRIAKQADSACALKFRPVSPLPSGEEPVLSLPKDGAQHRARVHGGVALEES